MVKRHRNATINVSFDLEKTRSWLWNSCVKKNDLKLEGKST